MDNQASLEAAVAAGNEATNRIAKAITAEAAVSEALKAQLAAQGVKPETIALLDAQTSRLNALSAAAEAVLSQGSTNPVPVEIPAPTPAPTPAPVV